MEAGEEIQIEIFHNFQGDSGSFLGINGLIPRFNNFFGTGDFNLSLEIPRVIDGVDTDGNATRNVAQFEVKRSSAVLNGTNDFIDVKTVLPDMKVYDFFTNINKMYNLLIIPQSDTKNPPSLTKNNYIIIKASTQILSKQACNLIFIV